MMDLNNRQNRLQKLLDENKTGSKLDFGIKDGKKIKWIVIERTDSHLLLITEKPILSMVYGTQGSAWHNSHIREELNGHFYEESFSDEEKELIGISSITNGANGKTDDRVYILSRKEINKLMPDKNDRLCGDDWQTREEPYSVHRGKIAAHGYYAYVVRKIRPVICLKIETEKKKPVEKGYKSIFKYTKDADGIIISGYKGEERHMIIPEEIDGLPVYRIKSESFKNSKRFNEVTFPKTMRFIGSGAFVNCSIDAVHINDLNSWAGVFVENEFLGFTTKLYCNENEVREMVIDTPFINRSSFALCPGVRTITIGESVKEIGFRSFYACRELNTFTVNAEDIQIDSDAVRSAETVYLNRNVSYIGAGAFYFVTNIYIKGDIGKLGYNAIRLAGVREISCNASVLSKILQASSVSDAARFCANYLLGQVRVTACLKESIEQYIAFHKDAVAKYLLWILKNDHILLTNVSILKKRFSISDSGESIDLKSTSDGAFAYYTVDDEVIIKKYIEDAENVIIPERIDNMPVTEISSFAFFRKKLKTIVIPGTVHAIGEECFNGCQSLSVIHIPEAVTVIEEKCFEGCRCLQSIGFPPHLISIEHGAFNYCRLLQITDLPETVLFIDDAFYVCDSISGLRFPDQLITMNCSFRECKRMDNIIIPQSLVELDIDCFDNNVHELTVADNTSILNYYWLLKNCEEIKRINCSEKQMTLLFDYLSDQGKLNIVLQYAAENHLYDLFQQFITKKKEALIQESILRFDGAGLQNLLAKSKETDYSKWIQFAQKNKKTAALAILMDLQNRNTTIKDDLLLLDEVFGDPKKEFALTFTDESVRIGKYKGTSKSLVIPERINGKPVTEIAARAYAGRHFESVQIPRTIARIGRDAFAECTVNEIIIDDLQSWKNIIFETELSNPLSPATKFLVNGETITTLQYEEKETVIKQHSFAGLSSISKLTIKSSKTDIGSKSFCGCANLQTIEIEGSLKNVGDQAFYGCSITSIHTSLANMKKILKTVNAWDDDDLIDHYIKGQLTINDKAIPAFEEYFKKHENTIIRRLIEDYQDAMLADLIRIHPLNKDNLNKYKEMAAYSPPCLKILEDYESSL